MFNKIKEIYNEYISEANEFIDNLGHKLALFKNKVQEDFRNPIVKRNYITGASILLVVGLLIANIYSSFAYYTEESGFSFIAASVGNPYVDYDYILLVYQENPNFRNEELDIKYLLTDKIPTTGYTYNGYNCQNHSTLTYDSNTKSASAKLLTKDVCSIYFDINR